MVEAGQWLRKRIAENHFSNHNFVELELLEPDHAVFRLKVRSESLNSLGGLHGGAVYTMADMATGAAACTDGRPYVTQNGALHFIATQKEGVVRAVAQVRHRGKTTAVVSVDVVGENDKLLATGEFAFFCVKR